VIVESPYNTVQYSTIQYSTIQYSTIPVLTMSDYEARLASKLTGQDSGSHSQGPSSPHSPVPVSPHNTSEDSRDGADARRAPQFLAAFAATMGNFVMGTTIGWSSPANPLLEKSIEDGGFSLTVSEISWVGSLMPLGALIGGQVGGILMSKLGRKGAMLSGAAMFALSYLALVVAPSVYVVYAGRLATGVCTGVCSVVCPVYVAETATPSLRGLLGSCVQLMVTFGILMVTAVGCLGDWRWLSISCLLAIAVWSFCLLIVPESPAHYISSGRNADARDSLEWLRGTNHVDQEFYQIKRSIDEGSQLSAAVGDVFRSPNRAPFIISLCLMMGQQFSGMNAVMFYCVGIFQASGSTLNPNVANIIIGLVQVVATILAAAVMDRAGRRLLLLLSSSIMVISIGVLGVFFYIADNLHDDKTAEKIDMVPVISLSLFVMAFSIGFGPIPWLMLSELFAPEVKSIAASISTTLNWTLAFFVTKFFSNLVSCITEAGAFWMFGGLTVFTFLYCLLFVPETKGKSLDDIQLLFRSPKPYFLEMGVWKLLGCGSRGQEDRENILQEEEE